MTIKKIHSSEQSNDLLSTLRVRFEENMNRHPGLKWADVQAKLEVNIEKLSSLTEMEISGGEPDVIGFDTHTGEYTFYDCSAESPSGRRSLCYDRAAHESRKSFKPKNTAIDRATTMGIELLTEQQYRELQKLGGAIFCDRRYDAVFTYHNGAESYYAARGFRGLLRV